MSITYPVELHEITNLTWPMWEACSIECPAMIGAECPGRLDRRNSTGGLMRCPGWSAKFPNAAAEVVHSWTLDSGQDEECGEQDRDGWFALFKNPDDSTIDGPMGAGVILCAISNGAVQVTRFDTEEELSRDWAKIVAESETEGEEG